jgi:hypothetical protein
MGIRDEIRDRFLDNLDRVERMVKTYETSVGKGKGRRSVTQTDTLRAAVVFLHASLEDLLRSLCEWKMPSANPEAFSEVPLVGTRGKTRFGLQELASLRGQTVDEIITRSVSEFLERSSFNHPGDIKDALEKIGLDSSTVNKYAQPLAAIMSRRHLIAHRADRNPSKGPGHHAVKSLSSADVSYWIATVERFANELLSKI